MLVMPKTFPQELEDIRLTKGYDLLISWGLCFFDIMMRTYSWERARVNRQECFYVTTDVVIATSSCAGRYW